MRGGGAVDNEGSRRRLERAAELLAGRSTAGNAQERAELDADDALREKRRKVNEAARADYLVREAMAQGKFDNLEYAGKPIPGLGKGYDPDWWVKGLIQREQISGLGPPAILLRTEDAELDSKLDQYIMEKQVRETLEDFNKRVIEARRQLQGGPPVITKLRDVDAEITRWRERRAAAAPPETEPEPPSKRNWWQRLWNGDGPTK